MSKKTIAIVDHVGNKAGMDYYSGQLAGEIAKYGIQCLLISNFTLKKQGVQCFPYFAGHLDSPVKKAINHLKAFYRAAAVCRKYRCDIAIVHIFSYDFKDLYALWILKRAGIHITAIVHDVESFAGTTSVTRQMKMLGNLADRLIVHNRFSFAQLTSGSGAALHNKVKIIPHGNYHQLVVADVSKIQARKTLGLSDELIYLLFFGQIKDVKGLDILLKAMPGLPENVHLVIAGKPWKNDFAAYQVLINELHIDSRVLQRIGFIDDSDRDLYFRACDILILPYKQIYQSGVMLMAMSYRIPIIASDLLPIKETIDDGKTGLLFRSEDANDLARVICGAVKKKDSLKEMAEMAWQQTKDNNNWHKIAGAIINW